MRPEHYDLPEWGGYIRLRQRLFILLRKSIFLEVIPFYDLSFFEHRGYVPIFLYGLEGFFCWQKAIKS